MSVSSLHHVLDNGYVWQAQQSLDQRANQHFSGVSSGYEALDTELPMGGWQPGQVCEIYHRSMGVGELSIVLPALAKISHQKKWVLWVAPPAMPYAPALKGAGINIDRVLVVHPKTHQEALWCLEEGLKSGHCSAVLGWLYQWDKNPIRRLQLAAQQSNSYCWLWPQMELDLSGSPAALRLTVQRENPWQLKIKFYKRRGAWPSQKFTIPLTESSVFSHFKTKVSRVAPVAESHNIRPIQPVNGLPSAAISI